MLQTTKPIEQLLEDDELIMITENYCDYNDGYVDYYDDFIKVFNPSPCLLTAINELCEKYHKSEMADKSAREFVEKTGYTLNDIFTVNKHISY